MKRMYLFKFEELDLNCIFCRSNNVVPIRKYKNLVIKKEFQLFGCVDCKSRFFDVDEDIKLTELYDEQAKQNSFLYQEVFQESRYWRREVGLIKKLAYFSHIESVLDIGCRTGDFLLHWSPTIGRVGVELSNVSSSIARRRGLAVYNVSIEDCNFAQKFNVVTCYAVVEHTRNPMAFVQKLVTLIEKGGILAIMLPTWECMKLFFIESLRLTWHMYSPPLHINFFSREKLDNTLLEFGFELMARRYTSGGMFNPLRNIRFLNRVVARAMWEIEDHTSINQLPIFDHMYSYYKKL